MDRTCDREGNKFLVQREREKERERAEDMEVPDSMNQMQNYITTLHISAVGEFAPLFER